MLTGSYTPPTFIASGFGVTRPATIKSGLQLTAGTVIGKVTATGLFAAYSSANTDGTERAVGFLMESIDTTSAGYNGAYEASMLTGGCDVVLYYDQCTGIDVDAVVDIGGKMIDTNLLQLF